jgi:hypothetical protein
MSRSKIFEAVVMLAVLAVILLFIPAGYGDELATAGRQVAQKWQNCIVSVQLVAKTTYSYGSDSSSEEDKYEIVGCVIDPSGLIVTSLASTNLSELFGSFADEDSEDFKMSSEVTSAKIILPDGKELPAKIVLRDKDLDLAFIRPLQKPAAPLAAIDLSKGGKVELFDPVIGVYRQGIVGNRAVALSLGRIASIIDKPRLYYVLDGGLDLGSAVFSLDGNMVGLVVAKSLPKGASPSNPWDNMIQVILTAKDIAEAAKQAPAEAK